MSENSTRDFVNVLVYSDNADMRQQMMYAVGRRVAADLPEINFIEAATWQGADLKVQENDCALLILDAETAKLGGIGFGKKVRDEYDPQMPYIIVVARAQDEWLARTSRPNAVIVSPINPRELASEVDKILRERR